ncbi:MAG TPA: peptidylprolyl isomerase [Rhodospirillales bacterium]|nr:peptidylprolyl isomerase [Rhodospirillales bacterium]
MSAMRMPAMRARGRLAAVFAALLLMAPAVLRAETVVARSGSISLSEQAVRDMIDQEDPRARAQLAEDPALLSQFVRRHLARMAILAEAKAKKWEQKPDVARRIEQARTEVVIDSFIAANATLPPGYPSEADVQSAYEANRAKFLQPRQYRIAQIFIAVPVGAAKAEDDKAKARIAEMHTQAQAGKVDFVELAKRNSQDPVSAAKGGELDWLAEDRLLPQIRDAVAGLEKGGISEPVRAPDGWHLLKLLDTRPAAVAPLADVREQLVAALRQQKAADSANAFVTEFLRKNPVQLDEIALSKLVQK